jgi:hypothetical protein
MPTLIRHVSFISFIHIIIVIIISKKFQPSSPLHSKLLRPLAALLDLILSHRRLRLLDSPVQILQHQGRFFELFPRDMTPFQRHGPEVVGVAGRVPLACLVLELHKD